MVQMNRLLVVLYQNRCRFLRGCVDRVLDCILEGLVDSIPLASSGVVVNVTPDAFIFEVFDREVFVVDKDVVSFFVCEGFPNCCSLDLIC